MEKLQLAKLNHIYTQQWEQLLLGVTLFLLLKAFSSGASSLTGVEAISNAVTNFKDPGPKNAVKTLVTMGGILAFLLSRHCRFSLLVRRNA